MISNENIDKEMKEEAEKRVSELKKNPVTFHRVLAGLGWFVFFICFMIWAPVIKIFKIQHESTLSGILFFFIVILVFLLSYLGREKLYKIYRFLRS